MTAGYFTADAHEALRAEVRAFAEREVLPLVPEMERQRTVHHALSRRIAAQGWIGVTIPVEYGGMGMGHVAKTVVIEELARVSGAMGAMVQASQLGVAKILNFGSEEQRRTWLPKVARGKCLPTIAVTESTSGGHVLGMRARAVRDGDDYVLNGHKVWVGNSHIGDVHGVVVRTGFGPKGLTAFLVEADRPGFALAPQQGTLGLHGFSFGELLFEDCRVPATNRLGEEGDGLAVAYSSSILYGRANLAAVSLGIHQAILDTTVAYASGRQLYGKPIAELDHIKQKLGAMASRLMTARITAYHAVHLLDRGEPCDLELMNAKLVNVEASLDSAREAMEIHAAVGLTTEEPIERFMRDAFHISAPAGTSDIQRLRLAEATLERTKGQWSERLRPSPNLPQSVAG